MMNKTFKQANLLQLNRHNNFKRKNICIVHVYYSVHKNNVLTEEAIVMAMSRLDEEDEGVTWKTTN